MSKKLPSMWENPGPDEGWAWMIVLGLFITGYTTYGALSCLGIIYPVFMNSMQLSPDEASWPFYISFVTSTITGVVVPILSRIYSIRQIMFISKMFVVGGSVICFFSPKSLFILLFFFGVPVGILSGSFIQASLLILGPYFQQLKARAQALSLTGAPLAVFSFVILIQYLTETFEYRAVILLIGGVVAQTLPSSLLLRPRNETQFKCLRTYTEKPLMKIVGNGSDTRRNNMNEKEGESNHRYIKPCLNSNEAVTTEDVRNINNDVETNISKLISLIRDLAFMLKKRETYFVVLPDASMILAFFETLLIVVDHGYRSGISKNVITQYFVLFGIFSLLSRIAVAAFADRKCVNPFHIIRASVVIKITTCVIFAFRTTPTTFLINAVLIPFSISGYNCLRLTYVTKLFEVKDIALILTLSNVLVSIGGIISPVLIGFSMSLTGDYRAMWAFIAGFIAFNLSLIILEPFVIKKK